MFLFLVNNSLARIMMGHYRAYHEQQDFDSKP